MIDYTNQFSCILYFYFIFYFVFFCILSNHTEMNYLCNSNINLSICLHLYVMSIKYNTFYFILILYESEKDFRHYQNVLQRNYIYIYIYMYILHIFMITF
jgi:hypothetical protein